MSVQVKISGFVSWNYGTTTGALENMMRELTAVIEKYGDIHTIEIDDMDFNRPKPYPGFPSEPEPDWRGWI